MHAHSTHATAVVAVPVRPWEDDEHACADRTMGVSYGPEKFLLGDHNQGRYGPSWASTFSRANVDLQTRDAIHNLIEFL